MSIERDAGDRDGTAALRERDVRAWARAAWHLGARVGVDELTGWPHALAGRLTALLRGRDVPGGRGADDRRELVGINVREPAGLDCILEIETAA